MKATLKHVTFFCLIFLSRPEEASSQMNQLIGVFIANTLKGAFSKDLPPLYTVFDAKEKSIESRKELNKQYKMLSKAIAKDPTNADFYISRGQIFEKFGLLQEALAEYKRAYDLGDRRNELLMTLGILFYRLDDRRASISYFKQILDRDSINAEAYLRSGIAVLYTSAGRLHIQSLSTKAEQAIPYFEKCLAISPQYKEALILSGYCYSLQKKKAEAITRFEKAIAVSPKTFSPYVLLFQIYLEDKDNAKACVVIEKARKEGIDIPEKYRKKACQ